ncbi:MAG: tRNA lysidine(34) synthetase TilS [Phycisphaerae bacterium]
MNGSSSIRAALRDDPAVRTIIRSWRALTGGRPVRDQQRRTLAACSAGVDSSALAIALAVASRDVVLGHVVHDMRPRAQALADAAAASELADRLGLAFVRCDIAVAERRGNLEHNARVHRYRALATLAKGHECPFIATGHHADDQLETMLMRLLRGGSVKSMAAVRERRACHGATLVRPMLGVTREDCVRICTIAGWTWVVDATNEDPRRTRARLRAQVVPVLRSISPGASLRAAALASMAESAARVVEDQASEIVAQASMHPDGAMVFDLQRLRALRRAVLAEVIVALHERWRRTTPDEVARKVRAVDVHRAVQAIGREASSVRHLRVGGMTLCVTAREVAVALSRP